MRRFLLGLVAAVCVAVPCFADDFYSATYTFTDNAAVTLTTMWAGDNTATTLPAGIPVKSVTIQAETQAARFAFKETPVAGSKGAVLAAASSATFSGQGAYQSMKICPSAAGSYPVVHIIVEF